MVFICNSFFDNFIWIILTIFTSPTTPLRHIFTSLPIKLCVIILQPLGQLYRGCWSLKRRMNTSKLQWKRIDSLKAVTQKRTKKTPNPRKFNKMTAINTYFSVESLDINILSSPIKRHKLADWVRKQNVSFCCHQQTQLTIKDRHYLRVKGEVKVLQANGSRK